MRHADDEVLVQRTLQGDGAAFSGLVDRYKNAVYGICLSLMGDFDAAEDMVQEAFIKAYLHLGRLEDATRFGHWLRVIAANECRLQLRRTRSGSARARRVREMEGALADHLPAVDEQGDAQRQSADREHLEVAAFRALDRLSEKNRQALTLYYLGGHGTEEMASFLGISIAAVKMRLYRARKQLQKEALKMVRNTLAERRLSPDFKERIRLAEATAFFSDIAGFSFIMEVLPTGEVITLLNAYLSEMTEIVESHGGVVDKYEGDAVVAYWEGDDHAVRACLVALDMQARLAAWRAEGKPDLWVRYGLSSGQMLMGNIGSRQLRDDTMMGDTVNLAARLEGESRRYGTHILIGEKTHAAVSAAVEVREVDRIRLPRRAECATVYEVLARKGELGETEAKVVELFRQGLELYRERNWEEAGAVFAEGLRLDLDDGPSRVYRERCATLLAGTPEWLTEEWDGVFAGEESGKAVREMAAIHRDTLLQQVGRIGQAAPVVEETGPGVEERVNAALAPAVVQQVIQKPEMLALGGTEVELTVFFSDIIGFSRVIESLSAEETVALLYECHSEMTEIILDYQGTVDKYEGDNIVAFWGAPVPVEDHAVRGCLAALDMQGRLAELGAQWRADGKPELKVGCGLNSGPAVVGNLGSRQKMDYTVMGHHVNLGARLERLTRQYGTRILISEHTCDAVGNAVEVRELDTVQVAGNRKPVAIYEVLARKGELEAEKARVVEVFARGMGHYRERDWRQAMDSFDEALRLDPEDGPSRAFRGRCEIFLAHPPEWLTGDGVFRG